MQHHLHTLALLLVASLAPAGVSAALIDVSDVELVASALATTQGLPAAIDFDVKTGPPGSAIKAEALVRAAGIPFPNVPSSVDHAFASSAADSHGVFGVGVNGFFFPGSLPPNTLEASGAFSQTITNNSTLAQPLIVPVVIDFVVPVPKMQFFGVGNSFPPGADPAKDVTAALSLKMLTKITHPDGSVSENVALDYGMTLFREPLSGVLLAIPSRDASGGLSRFEAPDGSFGFQLLDLKLDNFPLGDIGPGDVLNFSYRYSANAGTGFGETGIFAAIGDPFDLSASGVRFELQVGAPVPEPATWMLLVAGLLAVGRGVRARAGQP